MFVIITTRCSRYAYICGIKLCKVRNAVCNFLSIIYCQSLKQKLNFMLGFIFFWRDVTITKETSYSVENDGVTKIQNRNYVPMYGIYIYEWKEKCKSSIVNYTVHLIQRKCVHVATNR